MIRRALSSSSPLPFDRVALMGAVVEPISLDDERWIYEPKYDGIRVEVAVVPGSIEHGVEIWSRQGKLMTGQFPELVQALGAVRRRLRSPILVEGEVVAVDDAGTPLNFECLQGRIGLARPRNTDIRRIPSPSSCSISWYTWIRIFGPHP